jgi:hypothetical protein
METSQPHTWPAPTVPSAPAATPTPAPQSHARAAIAAFLIFGACGAAGLKSSNIVADAFVLRHVYGKERVHREHLTIVNHKPLAASNGDVLSAHGSRHHLIGTPVFFAVGAGGSVLFLFLLPRPIRKELEVMSKHKDENSSVGCLSVLIVVPMTILLSIGNSLWPNAIVVALVLTNSWLTHEKTAAASPPGQPS